MTTKARKQRRPKKAGRTKADGWGGGNMDVFEEKADMIRYFGTLSDAESEQLDREADAEIKRMAARAAKRRARKPAP